MLSLPPQIFPELRTERLILRELAASDSKRIFQLRTDPEVNTYIQRAIWKDLKEADFFIKEMAIRAKKGTQLFWAITKPPSTEVIGTICLWNIEEGAKTGELGYELLPAFQHMGIMQEAMEAVLKLGFEELSLNRIDAYTHRENRASLGLLFRYSFTQNPNRNDPDYPDNVIFELTGDTFRE